MLSSLGSAISEQAGGREADGALQRSSSSEPCEGSATVLVVGADRLFRETLKLFLEADGFTAIEGRSVDEIRDRISPGDGQAVLIYSLTSDVAVEQDLACILEARRRYPGLRTLVLAATINASTFLQTVAAGVEGLMLKDISGDVLQRAIRLVLLGQHLFPAGLAQHLLTAQKSASGTRASGRGRPTDADCDGRTNPRVL